MTQTIDHNAPPPAWQTPPPPPPPAKKKHPVLKAFLILCALGIAGIIGIVVLIGGAANSVKNNQLKTESTVPGASAPTGVTLAEFNQLADGMSYAQVSQVLGSGGTEMSRNDIAGTTTVMYQWQGASVLGNMNAMFQGDKMVSKAQFGLK